MKFMSLNEDELIKRYSLPKLGGLMSQQAEIVRMELTRSLDEAVSNDIVSINDHFYEEITNLLSEQTDPMFYINHRHNSLLYDNICYYKALQKKDVIDLVDTPFTMISPNPKYPGIVEICILDPNSFRVKYEYCDEFISIMRMIKATYSKNTQAWIFTSNDISGSLIDRAAETVTRLLNTGFNTVAYDEDVINKVKTSNWEPRYYRWITYYSKKDCFIVNYEQGNEMLLNDIKRLRGHFSKYNTLYVKKYDFLDLYDFGKAYAFKYSDLAYKMMEELRKNTAYVKKVLPVHQSIYQDRNIEVNEEIPGDLYDN